MSQTHEPPLSLSSHGLEEDDASREYAKMTPAERRPHFIKNKLEAASESFTPEEQQALNALFLPENMPGDWPSR